MGHPNKFLMVQINVKCLRVGRLVLGKGYVIRCTQEPRLNAASSLDQCISRVPRQQNGPPCGQWLIEFPNPAKPLGLCCCCWASLSGVPLRKTTPDYPGTPMKTTLTNDYLDNGGLHLLPEFELTFSQPGNELTAIRLSWLTGSLWFEKKL
jgi:hypothetical protein